MGIKDDIKKYIGEFTKGFKKDIQNMVRASEKDISKEIELMRAELQKYVDSKIEAEYAVITPKIRVLVDDATSEMSKDWENRHQILTQSVNELKTEQNELKKKYDPELKRIEQKASDDLKAGLSDVKIEMTKIKNDLKKINPTNFLEQDVLPVAIGIAAIAALFGYAYIKREL